MDESPGVSNLPVPRHNRNPIRSLRPAPMFILVSGQEVEFPALSAADWLEVLMREDWSPDDVFLDLLPGGLELILAQDEALDPAAVEAVVLELIEEASSRSWWIALRMIGSIRANWDVVGAEMILAHVDPVQLSLSAWLDAMMVMLLKLMKADQHAMFVSKLEIPPMGIEMPAEELEISVDQFMSMMGD